MAGHKRTGGDELLCESNSNAKKYILKATFEKWQKGLEMEHQTLSWLRYDLDAKGTYMVSLYCAICRKYEGKVGSRVRQTRKQAAWLITLLVMFTNLRWLSWKSERSRARGESAATLTRSGILSSVDDEMRERMAKKFDVCFMMAKESLPFTKYPMLLELESRHGAQRTVHETQWSHSLATSLRASARTF